MTAYGLPAPTFTAGPRHWPRGWPIAQCRTRIVPITRRELFPSVVEDHPHSHLHAMPHGGVNCHMVACHYAVPPTTMWYVTMWYALPLCGMYLPTNPVTIRHKLLLS